MTRKTNWIEITDDLTPEGIETLEVGQILIFNYEGSRNELRIVRKKAGKVWAEPTITYDPAEIEVTQKEPQ